MSRTPKAERSIASSPVISAPKVWMVKPEVGSQPEVGRANCIWCSIKSTNHTSKQTAHIVRLQYAMLKCHPLRSAHIFTSPFIAFLQLPAVRCAWIIKWTRLSEFHVTTTSKRRDMRKWFTNSLTTLFLPQKWPHFEPNKRYRCLYCLADEVPYAHMASSFAKWKNWVCPRWPGRQRFHYVNWEVLFWARCDAFGLT